MSIIRTDLRIGSSPLSHEQKGDLKSGGRNELYHAEKRIFRRDSRKDNDR